MKLILHSLVVVITVTMATDFVADDNNLIETKEEEEDLLYFLDEPPPSSSSSSLEEFVTTTKATTRNNNDEAYMTLTSPFYTSRQSYPANMTRKWTLQGPTSRDCVWLRFEDLDLEESRDCSNDFVAIYDGKTDRGRLMPRLCGKLAKKGRRFTSTTNALHVLFKSDPNAVTGRGFSASVGFSQCPTRQTTKKPRSASPTRYNLAAIARKIDEKSISRLKPLVHQLFYNTATTKVVEVDNCGRPAISPLSVEDRIVGGTIARPHSWPWQASIRYQHRHICGGSLVARRWVLSAAHCFVGVSVDPNDFEVWLGKHKKDERDYLPASDGGGIVDQQLRVEAVFIHRNYQKKSKWDSDLALLKLADPGAVLTDQVSPVCLPASLESGKMTKLPVSGTSCYVTGFGETEHSGGENYLKQVTVEIVSNRQCVQMDSRLNKSVTENMLCAYRELTDSCQGDSGGPLVCRRDDVWWLDGVVSFGIKCAGHNSPGVYTKTANFAAWLKEKLLK